MPSNGGCERLHRSVATLGCIAVSRRIRLLHPPRDESIRSLSPSALKAEIVSKLLVPLDRTPLPVDAVFSPLIEQALELAAQWHDQTYRKGSWRKAPFGLPDADVVPVPVMAHVSAVAMTLQRAGWDEETVAAGFLHDILEDGNAYGDRFSYEHLRALMGTTVADRVQRVSEQKFDAEGRWKSWEDRKKQYLTTLAAGSDEATAISLADKLHNLWSMNQSLEQGIDLFSDSLTHRALSAGPEKQRWFFQAVLDQSHQFSDPRLHPLREAVRAELTRFTALVLG